MPHNMAAIRAVYDFISRSPHLHDQSSYRNCVAGWTVRLHGDWGFLNTTGPGSMAVDVVNFFTGQIADVDTVAAELLGLTADEASYVFHNADNKQARAWLEDIVVGYESSVLASLETSMVADVFGDDEYPFGEVTA